MIQRLNVGISTQQKRGAWTLLQSCCPPKSYLQTVSIRVGEAVVATVTTETPNSHGSGLAGHSNLIEHYVQVPCVCKRASAHVHYSDLHEYLTIIGAGLLVSVEVLSFVGAFISGSVRLQLSSVEIYPYEVVSKKIVELTLPFEYVKNLTILVELLLLALTIVTAATLHSRQTKLHKFSFLGAIVSYGAYYALKSYCIYCWPLYFSGRDISSNTEIRSNMEGSPHNSFQSSFQ